MVLEPGHWSIKYITINNQYVTKRYTGLSTLMDLINVSNGKKTTSGTLKSGEQEKLKSISDI